MRIIVPLLLSLTAGPALAQGIQIGFEQCTVQILNQSVEVRADGTWEVPNIPSNGGQVRARLTCSEGVGTRTGQRQCIESNFSTRRATGGRYTVSP